MTELGAHLQSERSFQQAVIEYARLMGWRVFHAHDSRRSEPGFPDLVLARERRPLIFAELKTETGRVAPTQQEWLRLLAAVDTPPIVKLWRPSDWPQIEQLLR